MISIRGGAGLGDAIYLQAVARHLIGQGHQIEACTPYGDIFAPLNGSATVSPFRRHPIDRLVHYAARRANIGTSQFQDCCASAGIAEPVELRLDWTVASAALVQRIRGRPGPRIAVMLPRQPFARNDGFGFELLPSWPAYQRIINLLRAAGATAIQVGAGKPRHRLAIDMDLANKTNVAEFIDAMAMADGIFAYPSCAIPLAEALGKPALILWSRAGLQARRHQIIRQMTPQKLIHRRDLVRALVDDAPKPETIVADFLEQVQRLAVV